MKTKIIITAIITFNIASFAMATELPGSPIDEVYISGGQQVVVNNYYSSYGFEYASRLRRFHNTYVSFDFYSPVYSEVYFYNYAPKTWGISIYDPWYGYSAYSPSYYGGSGFGGSYWWGYSYWSSYGWNSWGSPSPGLSVDIHFGNSYRYYPAYYNRWQSGNYMNCCCPPVSAGSNYYPSQSYGGGSNPKFIVTGGRSSGSQPAASSGNSGTTQGSTAGGNRSTGNQGNNGNQGNSGSQGNNTVQGGNDKDKSNNGLRMGQYRRGVAEPTAPKPNEPARTNNPNVNDRTNPGRDKNNNAKPKESGVSVPAESVSRQQTQSTVKTSSGTNRRNPEKSSEKKSAGDEKSQKTNSSTGRRL